MTRQRLVLLVGTCVALIAGCRPQLLPDQDAILYYLKNARVQGDVQRAWPEGQTYVNSVLKADADFQRELNKLAAWQQPESLWMPDDPRWQDADEVAAQVKKLTELLEGGQTKRTELLGKLRQAVESVPKNMKLPSGNPNEFIDNVWRALALDGPGMGMDVREAGAKLQDFAQSHLQVCQTVLQARAYRFQAPPEGFDPRAREPFFRMWVAMNLGPSPSAVTFPRALEWARETPECASLFGGKATDSPESIAGLIVEYVQTARQPVDEAYSALADRLRQQREQFLAFAEQALTTRPAVAETARQKRYEGFRKTYLRKQIEALPKALALLIEKTQNELTEKEKERKRSASQDPRQTARLEASIHFWERRIDRLSREREQLKARTDEILRKSRL